MASNTENRKINIFINGKAVTNDIKSIRSAWLKANNALNKMTIGTKQYQQQAAKVKRLKGILDEHNRKLYGAARAWKNIKNAATSAIGVFIGGGGLVAVMGLVSRAFSKAFNVAKAFGQAQQDLAAVLGKNKSQIRDLREEAKKYGSTTKFTATEVSKLQAELAKKGFNNKEISKSTKGILDFAAAADGELDRSASIVAGTIRALNLQVEESGRVADVAAQAFSSSALDLEKFETGMGAVGPVANQAGVSLERVTAELGVLVDRNLDASTAGTGLRNIYLDLSDKGLTYAEAMDKIRNSSDANATAMDLFGKRGATVATILAQNEEAVAKLTNTLEHSNGAALKQAKTRLDSLEGSLIILNSAWEGFLLSVEDGDGVIGGFLRSTIDGVTSFLGLITEVKRTSDVWEQERIQINATVAQITALNANQENRKKLLTELKNAYPDYFGKMDVETVKNGEILLSLKRLNKEYLNKIILMKNSEKIADQQANTEKILSDQATAYNEAFVMAEEFATRYGFTIDKTKGKIYQLSEAHEKARDAYIDGSYSLSAADDLATFSTLIKKVQRLQDAIRDSKKEEEDLFAQRKKLAESLNVDLSNENNQTSLIDPKKEKENAEKVRGILEEVALRIKEAEEEMQKATTSGGIKAAQEKILQWEAYRDAVLGTLETQYTNIKSARADLNKFSEELLKKEEERVEESIKKRAKKEREAVIYAKHHAKMRQEIDNALYEDNFENRLATETAYWDQRLFHAQEMGYREEEVERARAEAINAITREKLQQNLQITEQYWGNAQQLASYYFDYKRSEDSAQLDAARENYDAESAALREQKEKDLITEGAYKSRKKVLAEQLAAEERAIKQKAFNRQKAADLVMAAINTALAVTKTIANLGLPAGAVPAALAGAMGAAQIAFIASKKPPKYEKGKPGDVVPQGPRHAEGGLGIYNEQTGQRVAEMEGGEPIISRATYYNNKPLVDALINSGLNHGGRQISINDIELPRTTATNRNSVPGYFEQGGFAPTESVNMSETNSLLREMIAQGNQPAQSNTRAYVVFEDIEAANSTMQEIESFNQL